MSLMLRINKLACFSLTPLLLQITPTFKKHPCIRDQVYKTFPISLMLQINKLGYFSIGHLIKQMIPTRKNNSKDGHSSLFSPGDNDEYFLNIYFKLMKHFPCH
jgi:hypothetical protein